MALSVTSMDRISRVLHARVDLAPLVPASAPTGWRLPSELGIEPDNQRSAALEHSVVRRPVRCEVTRPAWFAHHLRLSSSRAQQELGAGLMQQRRKALQMAFPGKEKPDYFDLLLFFYCTAHVLPEVRLRGFIQQNATFGDAAQRDVFFFNVIIIAITVNVMASAL